MTKAFSFTRSLKIFIKSEQYHAIDEQKKRYTLGINNKSRANASYKMIENVQDGPFTSRTKGTIISSKISEFARGLKIPSGKK